MRFIVPRRIVPERVFGRPPGGIGSLIAIEPIWPGAISVSASLSTRTS